LNSPTPADTGQVRHQFLAVHDLDTTNPISARIVGVVSKPIGVLVSVDSVPPNSVNTYVAWLRRAI
jgi:hypothetical protein